MNEYSIPGLVNTLIERDVFNKVLNNPLAQFGPPERTYLGPTILPEQTVEENEYTDDQVRYRTVVANDGTRYSPVQIKQSVMFGSISVRLGHQDIGSQLTAKDYDTLNRMLARAGQAGMGTFEAMQRVLRWSDLTLLRPLLDKQEKQRWEAIVDASVPIVGDNNYTDTFTYVNPTGHRVATGGDWANDSYDPLDDIIAGLNFLQGKGYRAKRFITSLTVRNKMLGNDKIRNRVGSIQIASGSVVGFPGRVTPGALNQIMLDNEMPGIETYDLQYRTQSTTGWFLKRTVFVIIAETDRTIDLDLGDNQILPIQNTLGYYGIGTAQGESTPGRISHVKAITDEKPYRLQGQAWQAGLPVVLEPEAIYVITGL